MTRKTINRRDIEAVLHKLKTDKTANAIELLSGVLHRRKCYSCGEVKDNSYFYDYRNVCSTCHIRKVRKNAKRKAD